MTVIDGLTSHKLPARVQASPENPWKAHTMLRLIAYALFFSSLAGFAQAQEEPVEAMLRVSAPSAAIKSGDKTLTTVPRGTLLFATKVNGNWLRVLVPRSRRQGWISTAQVEEVFLFRDKEQFDRAGAVHEQCLAAANRNDDDGSLVLLKQLLELQTTVLKEHPEIGVTCDQIALSYLRKEQPEKALPFAKRYLDNVGKYLPSDDLRCTYAHARLGSVHLQLRQKDVAIPHLRTALRFSKSLSEETELTLSVLRDLAVAETQDADSYLQQAVTLCRERIGRNSEFTVDAILDLVGHLRSVKTRDESRLAALIDEALDVSRTINDRPLMIRALTEKAAHDYDSAYHGTGDFDDAIQAIEEAIALLDPSTPISDRSVELTARLTAGVVYSAAGDDGKAENQLLAALNLSRELKQHPTVVSTLQKLCFLENSLMKHAEAEQYGVEALKYGEMYLPGDVAQKMWSQNMLAGVYTSLGQYTKAEQLYAASAQGLQQIPDDVDVLNVIHNQADFYITIRKFDQAERLHKYCLDRRLAVYGEANHCTQASLIALADIYRQTGRAASALELLQSATAAREKHGVEDFKGG